MNRKLVFASSNVHKIEEVSLILGPSFSLTGLKDLNILEEIEENGHSFRENAEIKARYVFDKTGLNVFADDSGLEIDFLGGAPGIYSARYSGTRDMKINMQKVLHDLGSTSERHARFTCCICLIGEGETYFFEGKIEGEILLKPEGVLGFGYDPIFRPKGYTRSFAEMGENEKNKISHRALALEKMKMALESLPLPE